MQDVMIDLETLGTRPGCKVLTIGAVRFDLLTGELGETLYLRLDTGSQLGFEDLATRMWWRKQSQEAQAEAFGGTESTYDAVKALSAFCKGCFVWGNGSSFDISIIEECARLNGKLDAMWAYNKAQDVRTIVRLGRLIGVDFKSIFPPLIAHHALHDAISQAQYVSATVSAILSTHPTLETLR